MANKFAEGSGDLRPLGKDNIKIMRNSLIPANEALCDLGDNIRRWDHAYVNNFHVGDMHLNHFLRVVFKYMPEDIMYARHEDDNVWEEDDE